MNNRNIIIGLSTLCAILIAVLVYSNYNKPTVLSAEASAPDLKDSSHSTMLVEKPVLFTPEMIKEEIEKEKQKIEKTKQEKYRKNWEQYIVAYDPLYDTPGFGGIRNVRLPFENNTPYPLDEVTVVVGYYRNNGEWLDTKQITFYDVPPYRKITVQGEDYPGSGKRVEVTIGEIKAKAFSFWFSNNTDTGDNFFNFQE